MCGCCDGAALNWPSLPQLWFCFLFFCFLKKCDFQRVCWKLNYMHSRSSCLSLWFIHSTYFSDYLLSNYYPPGILLLFSWLVVSDSSPPHGPHHLPEFAQVHVRFIWWCHPAISPSVALFFCFLSFPASGSLPISQLFASGGQSIGVQLQHQSFQWVFRDDFL